jgi:hypothetical protein
VAGALIAAGWWVWIDAVLLQAHSGALPRMTFVWCLPGLLACFSGCLISLTPLDHLLPARHATYSLGKSNVISCARCWLFCAFTLSFCAVVLGLGFVTADPGTFLPPPEDLGNSTDRGGGEGEGEGWTLEDLSAWPGVAVVLQTVLIFGGSLCWITARSSPPSVYWDSDGDDGDENIGD